jgi:hypothetical protein
VVDAGQLLEVLCVSLAAGVGVTALFSFVVLAGARSGEARRAGRGSTAALYLVLAGCALLLFAVAVVLGVRIMLAK